MIYFAQAVRERRTYTDFMIGLIMLNQYYKKYRKTFYIKEDISDVFENKKCDFYNIESNNYYKLFYKMRINAVKNAREDPMHRDDTMLKNLYIKRLAKKENINDMYVNGLQKGDNFLLDNTVKFYYLDKHDKCFLHYNDNKSKTKNDSSLKIKIKTPYVDEKTKEFTKDKWFITLPTFRINEKEDIKMLDIFCEFITKEKDYKNIILISGSNEYKDHFCSKFNFETTHIYDDGFTSKKLGYRKQEAGFTCKEKGSLESVLADSLYIQNSEAGYIDFMQVYNYYRDELMKYGMDKFSNSYYDTFITRNKSQAIDIIGRELKENTVFYL